LEYIERLREKFNTRISADPHELLNFLNDHKHAVFNNQDIRMELIMKIISRSKIYKDGGKLWID
jgi:hypothetical protein